MRLPFVRRVGFLIFAPVGSHVNEKGKRIQKNLENAFSTEI